MFFCLVGCFFFVLLFFCFFVFPGESFQHVALVQSFCEICTVKHFTRDFPKGPELIPASSFGTWEGQALGSFNLGDQLQRPRTCPG